MGINVKYRLRVKDDGSGRDNQTDFWAEWQVDRKGGREPCFVSQMGLIV
jgi:hypothetical protein